MPRLLAAAITLVALAPPLPAFAQSPQEEWARHGFQHGAWDCFGNCPNGRRASSRPAPATTRMAMTCQQNLDDGRTLVTDGRLLPEGARFKIVTYRPVNRADGWSTGPCTIDVTR